MSIALAVLADTTGLTIFSISHSSSSVDILAGRRAEWPIEDGEVKVELRSCNLDQVVNFKSDSLKQ